MFSVSKDSLNPRMNARTLKNRLAVIEHYRYRFGVEHAHWPHFMMGRTGNKLYKYKFNYAVKGLAAFMLVKAVADYKHINERAFLSYDKTAEYTLSIGGYAAFCAGVFAMIWKL